MIYSVLSDRLGNILFEIAAGISLARRLNVPFKAFVGQEDYRYVEYVLQYKNQSYVRLILRKVFRKIKKYIMNRFFIIGHYRMRRI